MSLWRRRRVPEPVAALSLAPRERRLAWALTAGGEPVVATDRGLHLPGQEPLRWSDVERALWQRPRLTVTRVSQVEGSGAQSVVTLSEDDGDLPAVVRTRVSASVAWSSHSRLVPAGGVRVVARRRPGVDTLDWQLVYDRDTDPADPGVRAQAEQLLEAARRTIG
jgi:hypothetical protein